MPRGAAARWRSGLPTLACAALLLLGAHGAARAQAAAPAGHDETAFDVMNLLAWRGLHDLGNERWNLYGQFTWISSFKLPFAAPYTNLNGSSNSLLPDFEHGFTATLTLFLGVRLWPGGEVYFVPEVVSEIPLSNLHGLGGSIQNFELQKGGSTTPQIYRARTYLRQTIPLGGAPIQKSSDPLQLGALVDQRRLVITLGNFTVLDVFDRNSVTGDPRQTFFNMAFMTHSSWDFTSDARGYSWGATVELFWDDWSARFGHFTPPEHPNQLAIDFRFWKFFGQQLELAHEHTLFGLPGAVRLLGYRNHVEVGDFDEAIAAWQADPSRNAATCTGFHYDSTNSSAPDLCWVRRPNTKLGIGIALEQYVARDVGLFARAMYSDGRTEVVAFNSPDRSLSLGAVAHGTLWRRPFDVAGVGLALAWISGSHARYLAAGGVDGFVGDGALRQGAEGVVEGFYSVNLLRALWLSGDYQLVWNPAFNADRGPVHILGVRVHAEF